MTNMTSMEKIESIERFREGLSIASDRARQLAKAQKNKMWLQVAINLDQLRQNGEKLYNGRQIARRDALDIVDAIAGSETVN